MNYDKVFFSYPIQFFFGGAQNTHQFYWLRRTIKWTCLNILIITIDNWLQNLQIDIKHTIFFSYVICKTGQKVNYAWGTHVVANVFYICWTPRFQKFISPECNLWVFYKNDLSHEKWMKHMVLLFKPIFLECFGSILTLMFN